MTRRHTWMVALLLTLALGGLLRAERQAATGYPALVALFDEWLAFERPPLRDGAPDYTAETMARKHQARRTTRGASVMCTWCRCRGTTRWCCSSAS